MSRTILLVAALALSILAQAGAAWASHNAPGAPGAPERRAAAPSAKADPAPVLLRREAPAHYQPSTRWPGR
jgi:hypothetical protein